MRSSLSKQSTLLGLAWSLSTLCTCRQAMPNPKAFTASARSDEGTSLASRRKGLRLLLTLDCIGIATTLAATGLPCLIRLFPHPDAPPASILVALAACVCNLFWAIFSFLAGNYAMMIATSGAACFGGLLALLSWF
ncbi:uncharacterized protein LOC9649330 [Selaginella moellendorffii]|uniref:uncharacterized protein LOC9649330 n=1 Tax=Selaginella moellendorffii TaxID=88036 RepID=UPI000D1C98DF|nr:uncharacterized protein LOC9649330 [Selaginella moellendorffii]|eukprot:XP_024537374.1 uncharacterized protein LOC9649330 [Selaginella moellendorffii]